MEEHIKHGLLSEQWLCTLVELSANIRNPSLRCSGDAAVLMGRARGQLGFCCICRAFQPLLIQALPPPGLRDLFSHRCLAAVTKERIAQEKHPKISQYQASFRHCINSRGMAAAFEPNWFWSYLHIHIGFFIKFIKYLPSDFFFVVFPIHFFFNFL